MAKSKQNQYTLSFSKEELSNPKFRRAIENLIAVRLEVQKYHDFIVISEAEFEIVSQYSNFVPKALYKSQVTFKGEVGKINGKKLVVKE